MATKKSVRPIVTGFVVHGTAMHSANDLNPAPYNPNKMTPQKYEALKKSILEHGFVEPVVVQKKGLNIIGGHHRVRAVRELCIELAQPIPELPCTVLDIDDVAAKKINLKLQHIHGVPDARMLGEMLVDIFEDVRPTEESAGNLGFDYEDVGKYIRIAEPDYFPPPHEAGPRGDRPDGFGNSVTLSLEFTSVDVRDAVKKVLRERAEVEKRKSGDIIAELLAVRVRGAKKKRAA